MISHVSFNESELFSLSFLSVYSGICFMMLGLKVRCTQCHTNPLSDQSQVDVFSFGIMLCEILARIPADPEVLPRTQVKSQHTLKHTLPYVHTHTHTNIVYICVSPPSRIMVWMWRHSVSWYRDVHRKFWSSQPTAVR